MSFLSGNAVDFETNQKDLAMQKHALSDMDQKKQAYERTRLANQDMGILKFSRSKILKTFQKTRQRVQAPHHYVLRMVRHLMVFIYFIYIYM